MKGVCMYRNPNLNVFGKDFTDNVYSIGQRVITPADNDKVNVEWKC